jgi:hypothetical protein
MRDPSLLSGFRQQAPASLTPADRLNFGDFGNGSIISQFGTRFVRAVLFVYFCLPRSTYNAC